MEPSMVELAAVHGTTRASMGSPHAHPAQITKTIRDIIRIWPSLHFIVSCPSERTTQQHRSEHFVYPNHRQNERLEGDPPLRKRPSHHGREAQRHTSLRDQTQPTVLGQSG